MVRTQSEIFDQIDKAKVFVELGSAVPGLSYEEGVAAALEWVSGQIEDKPIED